MRTGRARLTEWVEDIRTEENIDVPTEHWVDAIMQDINMGIIKPEEEESPKKFRSTLIGGPFHNTRVHLNREPPFFHIGKIRYDLIVDPDTEESLGAYAYTEEQK